MVLMHSDGSSKINRNKLIDLETGADDYDETATTKSLVAQIVEVLDERDSKRILGLITYNIVIICYLGNWITSTNSIALTAYANTIFFNIFALLVCLISIWVERNSPLNRSFRKDNHSCPVITFYETTRLPKSSGYPKYRDSFDSQSIESSRHFDHGKFNDDTVSVKLRNDECFANERSENFHHRSIVSSLGLEKYEVLALLVSSCLSLGAGSLVSIVVLGRLNEQPRIHTGRLGLGALLVFLAHLGTIIGYPDAGLNHVVCKALPCPTLRGCNPILAGNTISALILAVTHLVIHFWEIHTTDTAAAFAVLGLTAMSMLPLAFYTLSVIIQKLPGQLSEQLDVCLREALIIDGVLEFRNEKFWTKSFGKLAGTLQVRIRHNANETHVLENVMLSLSKIVSTLNVQEFREYRKNDIFENYPMDYYVNEILSSHDENIDDATLRPVNYGKSVNEINENVNVARIQDIIGIENSRNEIFAVPSVERKFSHCQRDEERGKFAVDETTMRKLTIVDNDNFMLKDRLWRGDLTKKNPLLYDTKIDSEKFQYIFVPQRNFAGKNEIMT